MTRAKAYLILHAALCVLLVVLLCGAAVGIYREGAARKAEHPLEPIYTREIVRERFASIAPLCYVAIGVALAGLVLGVKDERADKPARDLELERNSLVARVVQPTEAMRRAHAAQRRLHGLGMLAFLLCMMPVAAYLTEPMHFPLEDLEGMLTGLLRVLVPAVAVGIAALTAISMRREKALQREIEAAKARLAEERENGIRPEAKPVQRSKGLSALQIALIAAAVGFIAAGILNGSAKDVLYKAINICTECVGLG